MFSDADADAGDGRFGRRCLGSASSGYNINKVCKGMSSAVVSTLV